MASTWPGEPSYARFHNNHQLQAGQAASVKVGLCHASEGLRRSQQRSAVCVVAGATRSDAGAGQQQQG
eukprot:5754439-Prymnesium_polylepis.1